MIREREMNLERVAKKGQEKQRKCPLGGPSWGAREGEARDCCLSIPFFLVQGLNGLLCATVNILCMRHRGIGSLSRCREEGVRLVREYNI